MRNETQLYYKLVIGFCLILIFCYISFQNDANVVNSQIHYQITKQPIQKDSKIFKTSLQKTTEKPDIKIKKPYDINIITKPNTTNLPKTAIRLLQNSTTINNTPSTFEELQNHRKTHIKQTCEANGYKYLSESSFHNRNLLYHQLEILSSKSLLFCISPKTGTSNWKRIFVAIYLNKSLDEVFIINDKDDKFNDRLYTTIPRWNNRNFNDIKTFKHRLINVRHPLARLYSGWKDKFHHHPENYKYGRLLDGFFGRWDKYVKDYESDDYLRDENARVSFKAFIKWIGDPKSSALSLRTDYHWNSIFNICAPCFVDYTLFSKIEEADDSAQDILNEIEVPEGFQFPKAYKTTKMQNDDHQDFISNLREIYLKNKITEDLICKIYTAYKMDFLLFEYDILPFLPETKTVQNCTTFI